MIKRLEQVAALVVAAGLAIVSYWLFFSWAQGGGAERHQRRSQSGAALSRPDLWLAAAEREVGVQDGGPLV